MSRWALYSKSRAGTHYAFLTSSTCPFPSESICPCKLVENFCLAQNGPQVISFETASLTPSHLSDQLSACHRFRCWYPSDHVWRKCKRRYKVSCLPLKDNTSVSGTKFDTEKVWVTPVISCLLQRLSKKVVTAPISCPVPEALEGAVAACISEAQKVCLVIMNWKHTLGLHRLHYHFTFHMQGDDSVLGTTLGAGNIHASQVQTALLTGDPLS